MSTLTAKIQLRKDTSANWTSNNPVLLAGELAFTTDVLYTGTDQMKFKVGDGSQTWTQLDYMPIGGWSFDGNTVGAEKWIGTIDNYGIPFKTNNTERFKIQNDGHILFTSNIYDNSDNLTVDINNKRLAVSGIVTLDWSDTKLKVVGGNRLDWTNGTCIASDGNANINWLSSFTAINGLNSVCDLAGKGSNDLRVLGDPDATNGKGFYLKAAGTGNSWRNGIRYLNNSALSYPSIELQPSGGNTIIGDNTNNTLVYQNGTQAAGRFLKATDANGTATWTTTAASDLTNGTTGTGSVVLSSGASITSPTLTTPALGTPSSGDLTNCTGNYFTIAFETGAISPADATTYYFSDCRIVPNTTATNFSYNLGYAYKIIGIKLGVSLNSTTGSTENSTLQVRNITQATSTSVGTFTTDGSATLIKSATFTALNISIAAGDSIALQWDTPAWSTNPVGTLIFATIFCQKQ